MRRNTLALVASLALAACRSGNSGGDTGEAPPPVGDDGDGDGDGDPDEGGWDEGERDEDKPVCDLSQFPQIVPEWIVEVESPVEGGLPTVDDLVIASDTMFVAGRHAVSGSPPSGYLERRTLDGELLWALDYPGSTGALSWDGTHLYGVLARHVRRWSEDGVEDDDWAFKSESFAGVDASAERVAVVGTTTEWVNNHPDSDDAFYGSLSKTAPPKYSGNTVATLEVYDRGQAVVRNPWADGWVAAGYTSDPFTLWLHGFGGSRFHASLNVGDHPNIHSMLSFDGRLLLIGRSSSDHRMWMVELGADGNELWRRGLWVCGDVVGSIHHLVPHQGQLWSLSHVRTGPKLLRPLLVQLGWDGAVEQVFAVQTPETHATMLALRSDGTTLYLGGDRHDKGGVKLRVIGKVRP